MRVLDCRDAAWHAWPGTPEHARLLRWLADNGIPAHPTVRIEVYVLDAAVARVHAYATDEHGRVTCGREHPHDGDCGPVLCEPYLVMLASLPPEDLCTEVNR